jgi:hypothetical protein
MRNPSKDPPSASFPISKSLAIKNVIRLTMIAMAVTTQKLQLFSGKIRFRRSNATSVDARPKLPSVDR